MTRSRSIFLIGFAIENTFFFRTIDFLGAIFPLREEISENCHADKLAVSRLAKVGRSRIVVDLRIDFSDTRQRMHEDAFSWHKIEEFPVENVGPLDFVI